MINTTTSREEIFHCLYTRHILMDYIMVIISLMLVYRKWTYRRTIGLNHRVRLKSTFKKSQEDRSLIKIALEVI